MPVATAGGDRGALIRPRQSDNTNRCHVGGQPEQSTPAAVLRHLCVVMPSRASLQRATSVAIGRRPGSCKCRESLDQPNDSGKLQGLILGTLAGFDTVPLGWSLYYKLNRTGSYRLMLDSIISSARHSSMKDRLPMDKHRYDAMLKAKRMARKPMYITMLDNKLVRWTYKNVRMR